LQRDVEAGDPLVLLVWKGGTAGCVRVSMCAQHALFRECVSGFSTEFTQKIISKAAPGTPT